MSRLKADRGTSGLLFLTRLSAIALGVDPTGPPAVGCFATSANARILFSFTSGPNPRRRRGLEPFWLF